MNERRGVIGALALLIGSLLLVAAIGQPAGAQAGRSGGIVRINSGSDFSTLDPALGMDNEISYATCAHLMTNVWRPLPHATGSKKFSGDVRLVPEVAASYPKVFHGGRTYTFRLRRSFRFNTGPRVTAASFARAFRRVLDPKLSSPGAGLLAIVEGAQAVADGRANRVSGVSARGNTLTVRLRRAAPDFLPRLALSYFCAVPAGLPIRREGVELVPSAGPYYVWRWDHGRYVYLRRNRHYAGTRPQRPDQILFSIGNDPQTTALQVARNQVDFGFVPFGSFASLASQYGFNKQVFAFATDGTRVLALNMERPIFRKNLKLRKAIAYAIDRAHLVSLYGKYGASPTDQYLPPGLPGFRDSRIYPFHADPARAKRLARGHTPSEKIQFWTCNAGACPDRALLIKNELEQIGLKVEVHQFEVNDLYDSAAVRGAPFDIADVVVFSEYFDPYPLFQAFDGRTINASRNVNLAYFDSNRYNRRIDAASRLFRAARYRAYGKLDADLARNVVPYVAYANPNNRIFKSARAGCFHYNVAYGIDFGAICLKLK